MLLRLSTKLICETPFLLIDLGPIRSFNKPSDLCSAVSADPIARSASFLFSECRPSTLQLLGGCLPYYILDMCFGTKIQQAMSASHRSTAAPVVECAKTWIHAENMHALP